MSNQYYYPDQTFENDTPMPFDIDKYIDNEMDNFMNQLQKHHSDYQNKIDKMVGQINKNKIDSNKIEWVYDDEYVNREKKEYRKKLDHEKMLYHRWFSKFMNQFKKDILAHNPESIIELPFDGPKYVYEKNEEFFARQAFDNLSHILKIKRYNYDIRESYFSYNVILTINLTNYDDSKNIPMYNAIDMPQNEIAEKNKELCIPCLIL